MINNLINYANSEYIILTDANVFFTTDTLYNLIKHFKNNNIGIVGANIINPNSSEKGIAFHETFYMKQENLIKYYEGIHGKMIGSFGGCYAIRKSLFQTIPTNPMLMDDFYITMSVLNKNYDVIMEKQAVCFENVTNDIWIEFKEKKRIAQGTFPIITSNIKLWLPLNKLNFFFFSHKVIRYLTPFLIIFIFFVSLTIFHLSLLAKFSLITIITILFISIIDISLIKYIPHNKWLRFISHFSLMNIALIIGIIKSMNRKTSSIWQPTKR
jgi:cellulose synthase/poly-beta-1,6-N-acetylglucosamine synthase-like glycosyltransferase